MIHMTASFKVERKVDNFAEPFLESTCDASYTTLHYQ